ncbi:MAG TPA: HlyD family type I secretion periplasmic adaptor subunit [Magnetospirillum sp.]|jgi:HlyD family type I secretion membrane fusion protein|nr:HlyD family type I secretion periplasmic adaptor subunit [Magnetospirillum sp.]
MTAINRPSPTLPIHAPIIDVPVPSTDFAKPMRAGLAVVAVALGGFATWGVLAPLDSAVVTPGTVTVESKRKIVQHREGGIVASIQVKEGDQVAAGTVLARLQDATAQSQMETLGAQRDAKLAEQARLIAERDGQATIAFPTELLARKSDPKVADILAREQDRFTQRANTLNGQRSILESRITQLESQRQGRSDLEQSKRNQFQLLQKEVDGLRGVAAKGYFPMNKLRAEERELARLKGEMMSDGAGTTQTDKEIGETKLQILQEEQKVRDSVAADLTRIDTELNDVTQKLVAARDAVERLAVVAPVAGTVQNLKVAGTGAVVPPGGDLMELVPENDRLIVEAHVNSRDIDRVHVGQPANLRFSAFASRTTPVIRGDVEVVSADASVDEHTHQPYYTARVEVSPEEASRLPGNLKAGMPVEVMLEGGNRTPLQYFAKPLMDSFARAFKER